VRAFGGVIFYMILAWSTSGFASEKPVRLLSVGRTSFSVLNDKKAELEKAAGTKVEINSLNWPTLLCTAGGLRFGGRAPA
jgi:hypothetical protein